jgi:hypothetical protein
LVGFRLANPHFSFPEHRDSIQAEILRIDMIVQKAQDPVQWRLSKKQKKVKTEETPSPGGNDTRRRIAL